MSRALYPKKYKNLKLGLPKSVVPATSPFYNRDLYEDIYQGGVDDEIQNITALENKSARNQFYKLTQEIRGLHKGKSGNGNVEIKIDQNFEVRGVYLKDETSSTLAREIKEAIQQAIVNLTKNYLVIESDYTVKEYFGVVSNSNSPIEYNEFVDAYYKKYCHLDYDEEQDSSNDHSNWEEVTEPFTKMIAVSSSYTSRILTPKKYKDLYNGLPESIKKPNTSYYNRNFYFDPYNSDEWSEIKTTYSIEDIDEQMKYLILSADLRGLYDGVSENKNVEIKIDKNIEVRALHIKDVTSVSLAREIKQAFQQAILKLTQNYLDMQNTCTVKEFFRVVHDTNSAIEFNDFVDAFNAKYDHLDYDIEQIEEKIKK